MNWENIIGYIILGFILGILIFDIILQVAADYQKEDKYRQNYNKPPENSISPNPTPNPPEKLYNNNGNKIPKWHN